MIAQYRFLFPGAFESVPVLDTGPRVTRSEYGKTVGMG